MSFAPIIVNVGEIREMFVKVPKKNIFCVLKTRNEEQNTIMQFTDPVPELLLLRKHRHLLQLPEIHTKLSKP